MSTETHTIQLPFTTSHAFIVGINDYQHLTPLSTAVNDARVLGERLAEQHGFTVHSPLLNATYESLRKLLMEDIPKLVGEDDRVLFYFAGHGIALDGEEGPNGYLVAADTRPGQEETLIPMQLLHDALTELPCRHGLLILDCCFSGAFKWSSGYRDVIFDLPKVIYEERFWRYCKDEAWQVITSSAHDQKAVDIITNQSLGMRSEEEGRHSPFAASLLRAFNGDGDTIPADGGDGVMTATEMYAYLRDTVENETTENAKRQSPSFFNLQRHGKGEFIFLNPRHRFNLPPTPDRNPFLGLASYSEEDAGLFYGRDRVIAALHDKVSKHGLVVVSGASGTGKSSVIKAGILPQLRKEGYTVLPTIRPGKEPLQIITNELPDVEEQLAAGPAVLVIDQYEELITQCLKEEDRQAFEEQIASWLQQYPEVRILLSVRADFEPQFESEALAPWWRAGRYVVPVFSLEEIREVITKPAAQAVLFYEPEDLVEQLSEEVSQAPGALPLLSFTLSELYHAYLKSGREDRALKEEDYLKLGGVVGALRTRADSIYDGLDAAHQSSMRSLMLRMVSLEGGELASRRVLKCDLVFSDPAETERLQHVAQTLVEARLIFTGLDSENNTYYEPAHDALVRAWARLWEWIKLQGEGKLGLMYKLSLAVQDHHEHRTNEYLWHDDPRLDFLLADLQNQALSFNAQEESFLQKSKALQQRNKRRRWAWIVAVMIGLIGLTAYAFIQQGEAKKQAQEALLARERADQEAQNALIQADTARAAQARAETFGLFAQLQADTARLERDNANQQTTLAQQAQRRAEQNAREARVAALAGTARAVAIEDPTIGLNLALAAYRKLPTEASRKAWHDVSSKMQNRYYASNMDFKGGHFFGFIGPASYSVAFSPDRTLILTGDRIGSAKLWSSNGELLQVLKDEKHFIRSVAFSPDGQHVLVSVMKNAVELWSLKTGWLRDFPVLGNSANNMSFSPDGQKILLISNQSYASLWSFDGEKLHSFKGIVENAIFSPDGQKILIDSGNGVATLWSSEGKLIKTYEGIGDMAGGLVFSPDGQSFLTGTRRGNAKLWSIEGSNLAIYGENGLGVSSVAFSPDGKKVLTGNGDNNIRLWSIEGSLLNTYVGHKRFLCELAFFPDGQSFISGSEDGTIKVWMMDKEWIRTPAYEAVANAEDVVFSPDKRMLLMGNNQGAIEMRSKEGNLLYIFKGHESKVTSMAFSPDGRKFASGYKDGTIELWSLEGKLLHTLTGHTTEVRNLTFSPNGQLFVTGGYDNKAKLWSIDGSLLHTLDHFEEWVTAVSFFPDEHAILTGDSGGNIRQWSLEGELINTLSSHQWYIKGFSFPERGRIFLSESADDTAKLWSFEGDLLNTFQGAGGETNSAVISLDGQEVLLDKKKGFVEPLRNLYGEYLSGTLWNRVHKLTPEQQAEYGIDWEY